MYHHTVYSFSPLLQQSFKINIPAQNMITTKSFKNIRVSKSRTICSEELEMEITYLLPFGSRAVNL